MSAELERVFSSAKLTSHYTRNNLAAETIEMLELLRYWWINSLVTQGRGGSGLKTRSLRPRNPLYRPNNEDEDTDGFPE
jgi:hypothetical protein